MNIVTLKYNHTPINTYHACGLHKSTGLYTPLDIGMVWNWGEIASNFFVYKCCDQLAPTVHEYTTRQRGTCHIGFT